LALRIFWGSAPIPFPWLPNFSRGEEHAIKAGLDPQAFSGFMAVLSMPSFIAMASAVLNPMPRMSRAMR